MLKHRPTALLAATAILFALPAVTVGQVQLGAKAGLGITNFLRDPNTEFTSQLNFTGGFVFVAQMSRNFSLRPELLYTVRGANASETGRFETDANGNLVFVSDPSGQDLEFDFTLTYLDFPLVLRYALSPRAKITPTLSAGPVLSWKLGERATIRDVETGSEQSDSGSAVGTFDFGVSVGGGVDFVWDLRTIWLEARYTYGLSNLVENPDDPKHNSAIALTVGIGL